MLSLNYDSVRKKKESVSAFGAREEEEEEEGRISFLRKAEKKSVH